MNIPSTSNAIGSIAYVGADPSAGISTLGADDFMKLLTTQLATQDPMEPMKDTEFIAQMASFTSLEQMRTLSASFTSFAANQAMTMAPMYLGREVTVTDPDSETGSVTGIVDAIAMKDGAPAVVIGGETYDSSLITRIDAAS